MLLYCIEPRGNPLPPPTPQVEPQAGCGQGAPGGVTLCCVGSDICLMYLREPIVSKALERKLREWTIVNTLEALDSKFILTKALTKL